MKEGRSFLNFISEFGTISFIAAAVLCACCPNKAAEY